MSALHNILFVQCNYLLIIIFYCLLSIYNESN